MIKLLLLVAGLIIGVIGFLCCIIWLINDIKKEEKYLYLIVLLLGISLSSVLNCYDELKEMNIKKQETGVLFLPSEKPLKTLYM